MMRQKNCFKKDNSTINNIFLPTLRYKFQFHAKYFFYNKNNGTNTIR